MSKDLRATIALFLIVVSSAAIANAKQKAPAQKEIQDVLDRQVQAWNRGDLEGFMWGYWRSPHLTFYSGGAAVSGWDETLGRYRNRYQGTGNEMGRLEFLNLKIELLGPRAAFVRGRFHLKMSNSESGGLFTLTFRKFADGWKIVHDHTSTAS